MENIEAILNEKINNRSLSEDDIKNSYNELSDIYNNEISYLLNITYITQRILRHMINHNINKKRVQKSLNKYIERMYNTNQKIQYLAKLGIKMQGI